MNVYSTTCSGSCLDRSPEVRGAAEAIRGWLIRCPRSHSEPRRENVNIHSLPLGFSETGSCLTHLRIAVPRRSASPHLTRLSGEPPHGPQTSAVYDRLSHSFTRGGGAHRSAYLGVHGNACCWDPGLRNEKSLEIVLGHNCPGKKPTAALQGNRFGRDER